MIPHTTATQDSRWEVTFQKHFLKTGAFHLQQIASLPLAKLTRRLGQLTDEEFSTIRIQLREQLEL